MVAEHVYRTTKFGRGTTIILQGCEPADAAGRRDDDRLIAHVHSTAPPLFAEKVCALLSDPPVCNCGHQWLHPTYHAQPCPVAVLRDLARKLGYGLTSMYATDPEVGGEDTGPAPDEAATPAAAAAPPDTFDASPDTFVATMARLRSVFRAAVDTGFTDDQAMRIVVATMTGRK